MTEHPLNTSLWINIRPMAHSRIWSSRRKSELSRSTVYLCWCLVRNLMRPDVTGRTAPCWQQPPDLSGLLGPIHCAQPPLHIPQMLRRVRGSLGTCFYIVKVVGDIRRLFDLSERTEAVG